MDDLVARLTDVYRDLHAHPELSGQEHRTAGIAAAWLHDLRLEVVEGIGGTGVVGILRNGPGPTVLLRADMDALPVTEATGLAHASTVDGVMHACGHDVHVACLLGAADRLTAMRESWSGTLLFLVQPAEETVRGARAMVDDASSTGCRGRTSCSGSTSPRSRRACSACAAGRRSRHPTPCA